MSQEPLSIQQLVEIHEPGSEWTHLWTGSHQAKACRYDLHVCRMVDGGQLRLYVFKDREFLSYTFDPAHDAGCAHGSEVEAKNVDDLISTVISEVNTNALGVY